MVCSASSLLAHLWHPKRANERQLPTNAVGRRARLDDGSGGITGRSCREPSVWIDLTFGGRVRSRHLREELRDTAVMGTFSSHLRDVNIDGAAMRPRHIVEKHQKTDATMCILPECWHANRSGSRVVEYFRGN